MRAVVQTKAEDPILQNNWSTKAGGIAQVIEFRPWVQNHSAADNNKKETVLYLKYILAQILSLAPSSVDSQNSMIYFTISLEILISQQASKFWLKACSAALNPMSTHWLWELDEGIAEPLGSCN
jgi:hypothetical protein